MGKQARNRGPVWALAHTAGMAVEKGHGSVLSEGFRDFKTFMRFA